MHQQHMHVQCSWLHSDPPRRPQHACTNGLMSPKPCWVQAQEAAPASSKHQPWVLSCWLQAQEAAAAAAKEEEHQHCRGILAQQGSTAMTAEARYARMLLAGGDTDDAEEMSASEQAGLAG